MTGLAERQIAYWGMFSSCHDESKRLIVCTNCLRNIDGCWGGRPNCDPISLNLGPERAASRSAFVGVGLIYAMGTRWFTFPNLFWSRHVYDHPTFFSIRTAIRFLRKYINYTLVTPPQTHSGLTHQITREMLKFTSLYYGITEFDLHKSFTN